MQAISKYLPWEAQEWEHSVIKLQQRGIGNKGFTNWIRVQAGPWLHPYPIPHQEAAECSASTPTSISTHDRGCYVPLEWFAKHSEWTDGSQSCHGDTQQDLPSTRIAAHRENVISLKSVSMCKRTTHFQFKNGSGYLGYYGTTSYCAGFQSMLK